MTCWEPLAASWALRLISPVAAPCSSTVAGETGESAGQVLDAAKELARQSETLCGEVDKFLSNVRAA